MRLFRQVEVYLALNCLIAYLVVEEFPLSFYLYFLNIYAVVHLIGLSYQLLPYLATQISFFRLEKMFIFCKDLSATLHLLVMTQNTLYFLTISSAMDGYFPHFVCSNVIAKGHTCVQIETVVLKLTDLDLEFHHHMCEQDDNSVIKTS